ncbi:MAG: methionine synthase [Phycisphaerae bacterium]|nr:methionine synthase [Phycisphaerae bacterium]
MGTNVYAHGLPLSDFHGHENCPEALLISRGDVIEEVHASFLRVGCDAVETNTFGANKIVLAEFGMAERTYEFNRTAAEIARRACNGFATLDHPRFVLGSIGPGTKLPSLGHTTFGVLEDSYAEQVRGLLDGGCDVLIIETCQDILQTKAAICGATLAMTEKRRSVPLIVQVTIETTGTMLLGTDIAAALVAIEAYPQVNVIGLNCATGPAEMSEHVRYLSQTCTRRISVVPNAGLPQLVEGRPHYALTPAELARWLRDFVETDGVNLVGGCCGTTPEHMAAVVEAIGRRSPKPRSPRSVPQVSSLYRAEELRQDNSFLIVGERCNTNGSRRFKRLLLEGNLDEMVHVAIEQVNEGSHVLDVCVDYVGRDGVPDMQTVIRRYATEVQAPLMLDSTQPDVLEAGLALAGGKCIINSVNLEDGEEKLARVCGLARKYGAAVVALTIDEDPVEAMGKTAARKLSIAKRINDLAVNKYGLKSSDILFDCLTFPITTGNEADRRLALETLDGIEAVCRELPECQTILGVSNVSFGLQPDGRRVLNSVFLHHARQRGLTAAIVHAAGIEPLNRIDEEARLVAEDLIYDRRGRSGTSRAAIEQGDAYDPLLALSSMFSEQAAKSEPVAENLPVEERLKKRIIDGNRVGLEMDIEEARVERGLRPLEIINDVLLDGMKVVGDLFASGRMQLPFVLKSAETMKAAVAHLEPFMEKVQGASKGRIVLATVKGDVHDIGKNLVDIILTNNGYTVFNLGIKQPINSIIEAYEANGADAIGMSGLLVKSTLVMRENLEVLNERGLKPPIILGGAALTRTYVEHDLRGIYQGPVAYAKDAFEGLSLMDRLMAGEDIGSETRQRVASAAALRTPAASRAAGGVATLPRRSAIRTDVAIPRPPFWGSRVIEHIPLQSILAYVNEVMLFQVQWQYKKAGRSQEEYDHYVDAQVRPVFHALAARCAKERILAPQAVYGYWPCNADGDDLIVFDPQSPSREIQRFTFPRQMKEPYWCLSDFFRPIESGERDVVSFTIVTVGRKASEIAREWFEQNRYQDYLHLHGLGVESAEALAEYLHKQVRMELGISGQDAREVRKLFQQGYQGSRYSFGYPACPNLEDQAKLWPLLEPERIQVSLSEEFQLEPEQSTSAMICHHPEARYFNVR